MKSKVSITPSCRICEIGRIAPDNENMLCIKYGVVPCDHVCKHFEYDPLKREPALPNKQNFDKSDFAI
ncbi:MAG: hypothetical protein UHN02_05585 [Acutalibacteraceae bacterium]|nr:hypothetical protein [Acutalibacteraceae bacterium]